MLPVSGGVKSTWYQYFREKTLQVLLRVPAVLGPCTLRDTAEYSQYSEVLCCCRILRVLAIFRDYVLRILPYSQNSRFNTGWCTPNYFRVLYRCGHCQVQQYWHRFVRWYCEYSECHNTPNMQHTRSRKYTRQFCAVSLISSPFCSKKHPQMDRRVGVGTNFFRGWALGHLSTLENLGYLQCFGSIYCECPQYLLVQYY